MDSEEIKSGIISKIAKSDGHFKHQERGDPDLTFDEKLKLCTDIFTRKPIQFLTQYGSYLNKENLKYFLDTYADNATIQYQVEQLSCSLKISSASQYTVKNRR